MHKFVFVPVFVWFAVFFTIAANAQELNWGWKLATDPDDVINFLNGRPPYRHKIKDAEITAANRGSHIEFFIFYRSDRMTDPTGGWGWKLANNIDDVKNFMRGEGNYGKPPGQAKIVAVRRNAYTDFYIFYKKDRDSPHSDASEQKAVTEAAQKQIRQVSGLNVVLSVKYIKVKDNWAWLEADPASPDRRSNYEGWAGLLRKTENTWKVIYVRPCCGECADDPDCADDRRFFRKLKRTFVDVPQEIFPRR